MTVVVIWWGQCQALSPGIGALVMVAAHLSLSLLVLALAYMLSFLPSLHLNVVFLCVMN